MNLPQTPNHWQRWLFALAAPALLGLAAAVWALGGIEPTQPASAIEMPRASAGGRSSQRETTPTPVEACMSALPRLTNQPLGEGAFEAPNQGMTTVIEQAEVIDVDGAEAAFFAGPHDLTHDIDVVLRQKDEGLAIRPCSEVVILERELLGDRDPPIVADQAPGIRDRLATASATLKSAIAGEERRDCNGGEGEPDDILTRVQMAFGKYAGDPGYDPSADLFEPGNVINVNDLAAALACLGEGEEASSSPEEASSSPEEASSSPEETSSSPEETSSSPEETSSSPEEASSSPSYILLGAIAAAGAAVIGAGGWFARRLLRSRRVP